MEDERAPVGHSWCATASTFYLLLSQLTGWAMDGFGIYAYQDIGGAAPVVDQCGGHFGPVDTGEVVYHYHR